MGILEEIKVSVGIIKRAEHRLKMCLKLWKLLLSEKGLTQNKATIEEIVP
jgi:hypothetical protein